MPRELYPGYHCSARGCSNNLLNGSTSCDAVAPPPAIAFCIAGAARTFGTPLVQSHLQRNLVDALGGSDASRLFLLLKTLDSSKLAAQGGLGAVSFKQHVGEATVDGLRATLRLPWLAPRIGEAVIVNGSGSYTHGDPTDGDCNRPPYCVAQASSTAWQQYRMQACAAPAVQDSAAYNKSCCRVSISNAQRRNDEERMLMQAMGVAWCAAAAERHEARHAPARFGLVVFARPDLVWWQPFKPWCSWPSHVVLSCEAPGCDAAG